MCEKIAMIAIIAIIAIAIYIAIAIAIAIITKPSERSFDEYFKREIEKKGFFKNDCLLLRKIESNIISITTNKHLVDFIICKLCIVVSPVTISNKLIFIGIFNTWFFLMNE